MLFLVGNSSHPMGDDHASAAFCWQFESLPFETPFPPFVHKHTSFAAAHAPAARFNELRPMNCINLLMNIVKGQ